MSTIFRRNSLAVIVATLLLTGCELMPTRDADTASEPSAEPSRERAADSDDGASQDQSYGYTRNGLYLARNDQDISERRQRLLDEGHESVATDRVGFYMDVLTARLRQDLANQGVELSREDRTITLTFAGDLAFETNSATIHPDMVPILDALGQVLEEYHASIITVAGHTDSAARANSINTCRSNGPCPSHSTSMPKASGTPASWPSVMDRTARLRTMTTDRGGP